LPKFKSATAFKISGICGFLAPVLAFAFIFSAVASYPHFRWMDNALSDLGVVPGITATLFNSGLIISGVLCLIFATGLFVLLGESIVGKIGTFLLVLASLALVAIGVFPESVQLVHYFVSVAFFVLLPVSTLVIFGAFWLMSQVRMAVFTLLTAIAAATPWVLLFLVRYVSGVALTEAVSAFAVSIWAVVLSGKLLKQASRSKIP
jgi:hypothetical membrane protein